MVHLDFIEIGTCDFAAEILRCSGDTHGISVEPIAEYLNRLPNLPNVRKINAAISNYNGDAYIYYIDESDIARYNLSYTVKGLNMLGAPHPTVLRYLSDKGVEHSIIKRRCVPVISVVSLLDGVNSIQYLKIDTEGHDSIILNALLDYIADKPYLRPKHIYFESNSLTPLRVRRMLVNRLRATGYSVYYTRQNTTAILNLT